MGLSSVAAAATADDVAGAAYTQPSSTNPGDESAVRRAALALRTTAALWFSVAVVGQLLFALYVTVFYGRAAVLQRLTDWNKTLQHGYVPGDTAHNIALASHLLLAVFITVGGTLQLIPQLRKRWPRFHRWTGRIYVPAAMIGSLCGLFMVWTGHSSADELSQNVGISVDALLILLCGTLAWRHALARRFDIHRRWAIRLFLASNAGWFFRIGLMLWIVANRGPVGFDPKTFTGPFLTFLSFADSLLPLAILQIYFLAQRSRRPRGQVAMAGALTLLTLMTAGGIAAAAGILWLPHL